MVNYWLDANTFITPSRQDYYQMDIVPGFWDLLDQCAQRGIGSPVDVYDELAKGNDGLAAWVKERKNSPLWVIADPTVQTAYTKVANHVRATYPAHLCREFLRGADAWVIAYAIAHGGKIVTFENRRDHGVTKLKIPSVGDYFQVTSVNLFRMMRDLMVKFILK